MSKVTLKVTFGNVINYTHIPSLYETNIIVKGFLVLIEEKLPGFLRSSGGGGGVRNFFFVGGGVYFFEKLLGFFRSSGGGG